MATNPEKETRCKRCNRKLYIEKSIETGYGSICLKKERMEEAQRFFERNQMTIYDYL